MEKDLPERGSWCLYILRCGDGSLYTGVTTDLSRRLRVHREGRGAKYTRGRGELTLVYWESCPGQGAALRRERQVKKLKKREKLKLIQSHPLSSGETLPGENGTEGNGKGRREAKVEREILLLGDPRLYQVSQEVKEEELEELRPMFEDLFDCIRGIRRDYGFGRAIAAPQIGIHKRVICMLTDKPYVILNPHLSFIGDETMELMDDCMSFPGLLVRVRRHRHCLLRYRDENWVEQEMQMDDDMAELIQHEYDHLDGILATMRALDSRSFVMKKRP